LCGSGDGKILGNQKKLASARRVPQHRHERFAGLSRFGMKARIIITPKKAVVDPQGKAVLNALGQMGYKGISAVHVGKYLEIELNGADTETARRQLDEACRKFLTNPVIEDYRLEIE
jgi:phosphoribosylformylglycinamidine synthase PurS subunit